MTNEMQEIDALIRLNMTRDIVVAAASSGAVTDLAKAIAEVHAALRGLGGTETAVEIEVLTPAVPIKKSVFPDRIISLETGRPFKSIKRHIGTLGMTPDQYRAKWGLPKDYPMVCSDYSATRSRLAKDNKLGHKGSH